MRAWIGALAALVLLQGPPAWAEQSAWQQVWRSESAADDMTMVGRAQTMTAGDGRSLSATAEVSAAKGKVRLDYRTDRRRWSLIDDGRRLIWLQPRDKTALVQERRSLAIDRGLAERNYSAREAGEGTIAGRNVIAIEILPREGGQVVQRLWLDRGTGFALKRERYNAEARLISGTEYLEVEFGRPVAADIFETPAGWRIEGPAASETRSSIAELSKRLGFEVRPPQYLPRGYELLGGYEQRRGRRHMQSAELRYTDGLRLMSVFERPRTEEEGRGLGRQHGGRARGGGHGRGGGGRGRGEGGRGHRGMGPPMADLTVNDRATEKIVRYLGPHLVVYVVGDLAADEIVRVAKSVD